MSDTKTDLQTKAADSIGTPAAAKEIGRYCGYCWASNNPEPRDRDCYFRHREGNTLDHFCNSLAAYLEPKSPDNFSARERLYLIYAREIEGATDDLDEQSDFWAGFREQADSILLPIQEEIRRTKRNKKLNLG